MKKIGKFFVTSLYNLTVSLNLGVTHEERNKPQKIRITFKIYQSTDSECYNNDDSKKYICYAALATKVKSYCSSKEFKLLEYLGHQIYKLIKSNIPINCPVYVMVEKLDPKIKKSECIAKCEYSDFNPT